MNILEQIVADKYREVAHKKSITSTDDYERMPLFAGNRKSLRQSLLSQGTTGIIAEFKRKSPSKGIINAKADVAGVTSAYAEFAAGISVLTDESYFGGGNNDIIIARQTVNIPLLRKDFMVDEYQLYEARAIGADVILLIAAALSKQQTKHLAHKAKELQLEVLLEVHNEEELGHLCDGVTLIGVNNRNLKTFQVSINTSLDLIDNLPKELPAVAESGISEINSIVTLRNAGFKGFLIGETFMKHADPSVAFRQFANQLKQTT